MTERDEDVRRDAPMGDGGEPAAPEAPPGEGEGRPGPASAEDEAERLRTRLAYLAAEFDNYKKRTLREREATAAFANERILLAVLPFLDNLERAMAHAASTGSGEALLSGIRMTYEQFLAELRRFGLARIDALGAPFDPVIHEAVATIPGGGRPEGTVVAETRGGYLLNGRLLRAAQVAVAGPAAEGAPGGVDLGAGEPGA